MGEVSHRQHAALGTPLTSHAATGAARTAPRGAAARTMAPRGAERGFENKRNIRQGRKGDDDNGNKTTTRPTRARGGQNETRTNEQRWPRQHGRNPPTNPTGRTEKKTGSEARKPGRTRHSRQQTTKHNYMRLKESCLLHAILNEPNLIRAPLRSQVKSGSRSSKVRIEVE